MTLSTALIYFGIVCFLVGVLIIAADRKMIRKCGGNEALRERVQFFTNKWQGEHANIIVATVTTAAALILTSAFTNIAAFIYLSGVVVLLANIYSYNKMMIYVEANAFNGEGQK